MTHRKEGNYIFINVGYNPSFNEEIKKRCGAKWNADTKEWKISVEYADTLDKILLEKFRHTTKPSRDVTIDFLATDFYDSNQKRRNAIRIEGYAFAIRNSRDSEIKMIDGTIILQGGFTSWDGSAQYPACEPLEGTILRATIKEVLLDSFSEETKSKLKIRYEDDTEVLKAELLARKEALLAELAEIESKLQNL